MAGRSRVGSNTGWLAIRIILVSLLGLLQMKIFTAMLSLEEMGLLQVMRGLAGLLVALGLLGLPNLLMRYLPQLETRGEGRRILRVALISGGLVLAGLSLVSLLAWLLRGSLAQRFDQAAAVESLLPWALMLVLGLGITELAYGLYMGIRRMGPMALAEMLASTLLTFHLWWMAQSLDARLALALLALYFLLRGAVLLLIFPRFLGRESVSERPLRIVRKELLNYWGLSLFLRWLALAYLDLDRAVIGAVAPLAMVSLFHVPARLISLSKGLLAAPTLSLQTEVSRFYEERREGELPARLQLFLRVQVLIALWLATLIFLGARPLILLSSTSAYLEAVPLLLLLLISLPLSSLAAPLEAAFRGLDGLKVVLVGNLLWALSYFGSLIWLVGALGLLGLGLAQILGASLQVTWVLVAAGRRGWLRGLGRPLGRGLLWGGLPVLAALTLSLSLPGARGLNPGWVGLVAGVVLLLLGSLIAGRSEGLLSRDEKRWLLGSLPMARLRRFLARLLCAGEVSP